MGFIDRIKERAKQDKKTIVLPESMDKRTYEAAVKCTKEGIANIILIGILIGATDVVSEEAFKLSLEEKFKEKKPEILEMNLKALSKGLEIGKKYKK